MAKGGKLTKLKSVLKKWNSFSSKQSSSAAGGRSNSSSAIAAANHSSDESDDYHQISIRQYQNHHAVYVGKSRRQYLISTDVMEHPLFQELVERSSGDGGLVVGCEVVMFEHLLWMLHNADDPQPESLDELVDFYACC